jgi:hypothetical protein
MATKQIAQGLAGLGRYGDSTLVHMQPEEVAGLQALAKTQGTTLTINPETGLPEAFSLGGFFNSLLPTIAGFAAAGMSGGTLSPMVAGILAGAGTGALTNKKDPLMGAAMGGLGGYGGANLFSAAKGFTPAVTGAQTAAPAANTQAIEQAVSQAGGVMDPLMKQQISMFTPAGGGVQTAGIGGPEATYGALTANTAPTASTFAPNYNPIPGAVQGTGGYQPPSLLASDTSNIQQAYSNVAADPMGFIGQNKMGVGMPLGMAALSGLEPSDIYGDPMKPDTRGKYDPYATLNLSGDTGLRLYAAGGPVSFADGGDTGKDPAGLPGGGLGSLQGGNAEAMQGSNMLPLDVSDINAKYGYNPQGMGKQTSNPSINAMGSRITNMGGPGVRSSMPIIQAPMLGLFADNDQIEAARTAYETQLAAAMSGRSGMGSFPAARFMGQGIPAATNSGNYPAARYLGQGTPTSTTSGNFPAARFMGSSANTAPTASTASTAETALSRLNLNKQYANGGAVSHFYGGGQASANMIQGVRDRSSDNVVRVDPDSGRMYNNDFSTLYKNNPEAVWEMVRKALPWNEGVPMRNYLDGGSGSSLGGSEALKGGNLNLNTASGLGYANGGTVQTGGTQDLYGSQDDASTGPMLSRNGYGLGRLQAMADGGMAYAKGGYLDGPGDGMSDSIPATIEGKQPARLADSEFVLPADVVSHIGNGSSKAGAKRLYKMMDQIRLARTGSKKQGKQINPNKFLPA